MSSKTGSKDDERAARLKAALRDNLRRRKAQARGRSDDAPEVAQPAPAAGPDPVPDAEPAS